MSADLVTLSDKDADNSLVSLIADLVRQNVEHDPSKALTLTALEFLVTIVATDLDSSVTLEFRGTEGLLVRAGPAEGNFEGASAVIRADSNGILDLARLSLLVRTGLPIVWNRIGASVLRRLIRGEIAIERGGRHLGKLTRLLNVISVA